MAGIGHEPATQGLRGLEAIRQAVELLPDLGDLIPAGNVGAVFVSTLPHLADAGEQGADLAGQHPGEDKAQQHHRRRDTGGQLQEVALQPLQQLRLFGIVFIGVDGADDPVLIQHRRGRPAAESAVPVGAGKGVVALQRLHNLRIERVLSHGSQRLPRVIKHLTGAVRHQNAAQPRLLHHRHGGGHILLIQSVQPRQRVHHHGDAPLHGSLLGTEHQILADQQGVCIQQKQHRRNDGDVAQAEFQLQTAPESSALIL